MIHAAAEQLKNSNFDRMDPSKVEQIAQKIKTVHYWFDKQISNNISQKDEVLAPVGAQNLLRGMIETAQRNALRPKQGYRYKTNFKRLLFTIESCPVQLASNRYK